MEGKHSHDREAYVNRSYLCEDGSNIIGADVCMTMASRAFRREVHTSPELETKFPYASIGSFVGTAAAVRRVLRKMIALHEASLEVADMALVNLLLVCNRTEGLIDTGAELFLSLGGHQELDLERPLCSEGYFDGGAAQTSRAHGEPALAAGLPPPVFGRPSRQHSAIPAVLHFDGRHAKLAYRDLCIRYFRAKGLLGRPRYSANCTFFDAQRDRFAIVHELRSRGWRRNPRADREVVQPYLLLERSEALEHERGWAAIAGFFDALPTEVFRHWVRLGIPF